MNPTLPIPEGVHLHNASLVASIPGVYDVYKHAGGDSLTTVFKGGFKTHGIEDPPDIWNGSTRSLVRSIMEDI